MENLTMRNFGIKNFAVILGYLILLCTVAAVSARKVMSNVPDAATQLKQGGNGNNERFKNCLICGRSNTVAEKRENVINGDPVNPPNKYPWMVQINSKNICGGAILDRYHILTAAHCLVSKECSGQQENCKNKPNEVVINLLTSNAKEFKKGPPVKEIFIHPKYTPSGTDQNDIAIVKLKNPITCNAFASPICLPPPNLRVPERSMFIIAGWGATTKKEIGRPSTGKERLLEAKLYAVDAKRCSGQVHGEERFLCVIGAEGKSPCFGDSGGPMFRINDEEKVAYTVGVASAHTSHQCDPKKPAVYTDVSKYLKYIQQVTGLRSAREVEVPRNNIKGCKRT